MEDCWARLQAFARAISHSRCQSIGFRFKTLLASNYCNSVRARVWLSIENEADSFRVFIGGHSIYVPLLEKKIDDAVLTRQYDSSDLEALVFSIEKTCLIAHSSRDEIAEMVFLAIDDRLHRLDNASLKIWHYGRKAQVYPADLESKTPIFRSIEELLVWVDLNDIGL